MKHRIVLDFDDETEEFQAAVTKDRKTALLMLGHAIVSVSGTLEAESGIVVARPDVVTPGIQISPK